LLLNNIIGCYGERIMEIDASWFSQAIDEGIKRGD
jgi:hypothetical protein